MHIFSLCALGAAVCIPLGDGVPFVWKGNVYIIDRGFLSGEFGVRVEGHGKRLDSPLCDALGMGICLY